MGRGSMLEFPLVSVIMPSYNSAEYVASAILSVLKQTYKNLELIVVDDASTDNTLKIVNSFKKDVRLIVVSHQQNLGVYATRNSGLKKAKGQYISFIDSDDMWLPNKLDREIAFMRRNYISFLYSYYQITDEKGQVKKSVINLPRQVNYEALLKSNSIPLLTVVLSSKLLYKEQFRSIHHEDYALWLEILRTENVTAHLIPEITAIYRVRKGSISSNKIKSAIWTWQILRHQEKVTLFQSVKNMLFYIIEGVRKHSGFLK